MKLLITGGAGFIGSAFVRLAVKQGFDVCTMDSLTYAGDFERIRDVSPPVRFHSADISDEPVVNAVFASEKPEAVIHFAAETHVDRSIIQPRAFMVSNVLGTETLLSASLRHQTGRFIHISTDEVYGELLTREEREFTETDPLVPNSPYSASKAGADMLARAFSRTYGLPVIIARPSNNYGPRQYPEKLLPLCIAKLLLGEKIPVYGKGDNIRTWLFVDDCARAVMSLLEKGEPGEVYNIGSREERVNLDVVRSLARLMGKDDSVIEFVPDRPGHDFRYAVTTEKITKHTGWSPQVTFDEGLRKTVEWYLGHKDWLLRKKADVDGFVHSIRQQYERMKGSLR